MNAALKELMDEEVGLQIAPLIDMTFLLLIYFLISSSLKAQEADLGIHLPGEVSLEKPQDLPEEQIIDIDQKGRIGFNGKWYDNPNEHDFPELVSTLVKFKRVAEAGKQKAMITIDANENSLHQRTIDVMNACAAAGIKDVSFTMGE
jgi:biopolymer transport protein ExbD